MPISDELFERLALLGEPSGEVWESSIEGRDHLAGDSTIFVEGSAGLEELVLLLYPAIDDPRARYDRTRTYSDLIALARTHLPELLSEIRAARGLEISHSWQLSTENGRWLFDGVDAAVASIEVDTAATIRFPGHVSLRIQRECIITHGDVVSFVTIADSVDALLQLRGSVVHRVEQTKNGGLLAQFSQGVSLRVEPVRLAEAFSLVVPGVQEFYASPFGPTDAES